MWYEILRDGLIRCKDCLECYVVGEVENKAICPKCDEKRISGDFDLLLIQGLTDLLEKKTVDIEEIAGQYKEVLDSVDDNYFTTEEGKRLFFSLIHNVGKILKLNKEIGEAVDECVSDLKEF